MEDGATAGAIVATVIAALKLLDKWIERRWPRQQKRSSDEFLRKMDSRLQKHFDDDADHAAELATSLERTAQLLEQVARETARLAETNNRQHEKLTEAVHETHTQVIALAARIGSGR